MLVFWIILVINFIRSFCEDTKFDPLTYEFIQTKIDNVDMYNKYATPTQYDNIATNVSISMYIEGISSFSAQTMDYHLDMYFYQEWNDKRLRHNSSSPILVKEKSILKKIWYPDLYFANARHSSFQDVTVDNFVVWVYPDGTVWYDCRISLIVICTMDLWKYPLDSQKCDLRILSYAYPESVLRLFWSKRLTPIEYNPDIKMADMELIEIKTGTCDGTYSTGVWSCMTAEFHVQRQMMHHIIQTYIPTALIVVISWFNFWLDINSVPARVSLSITTLLTISTQANAVKLSLPEVSYMKAIDAFVFGVMIEFTVCHFARNHEINQINGKFSTYNGHMKNGDITDDDSDKPIMDHINIENGNGHLQSKVSSDLTPDLNRFATLYLEHLSQKRNSKKNRKKQVSQKTMKLIRTFSYLRGQEVAQKIDEKSRYIFPSLFIIFNIVYWTFYLYFN